MPVTVEPNVVVNHAVQYYGKTLALGEDCAVPDRKEGLNFDGGEISVYRLK
jgi:hypothetical protein